MEVAGVALAWQRLLALQALFGASSALTLARIWYATRPPYDLHSLISPQSEELQDASIQLPRAMMFATVGNGLLGVRMYGPIVLMIRQSTDPALLCQQCSSCTGKLVTADRRH